MSDARFEGVFNRWFYHIMKTLDFAAEKYGFENYLETFELLMGHHGKSRVQTISRDLLQIEKMLMKSPVQQVAVAYSIPWAKIGTIRDISTAFLLRDHAKNMQINVISAYNLTVVSNIDLLDEPIPYINLMMCSSTVTKKAFVSDPQ